MKTFALIVVAAVSGLAGCGESTSPAQAAIPGISFADVVDRLAREDWCDGGGQRNDIGCLCDNGLEDPRFETLVEGSDDDGVFHVHYELRSETEDDITRLATACFLSAIEPFEAVSPNDWIELQAWIVSNAGGNAQKEIGPLLVRLTSTGEWSRVLELSAATRDST